MVENDLKIILNKVDFIKLSENIIENVIKKDIELDVDDVIQLKNMNQSLANNKPYCVLVIPHEFSSLTKEGREYMATISISDKTIAIAIVSTSLAHKIVANFYLSINKPLVQTKLFSTREKALEWLTLQYKNHK